MFLYALVEDIKDIVKREDREEFLLNIWIKNMSGIEQF